MYIVGPHIFLICRDLGGKKRRSKEPSQKPEEDAFNLPILNERTLGERVAALNGADTEGEAATTSGATASAGPVTADSLSVVLTQALRAEDKVRLLLLLQCVQKL